jgi:hypothetical protein
LRKRRAEEAEDGADASALASGEPGLNHLLARELRGLRPDATQPDAPAGERVTFATLSREARAVIFVQGRTRHIAVTSSRAFY